MFSVPSQLLLDGLQGFQAIQGGNNQIVQIVAPNQLKAKSSRPTEIRPKQPVLLVKKPEGMFPTSSCSANPSPSPKTTNILEEASKVHVFLVLLYLIHFKHFILFVCRKLLNNI